MKHVCFVPFFTGRSIQLEAVLMVDWWLGLQAQHNRVFIALAYLTYGSSLLAAIAQTNWVSTLFVAVSAALFGFLYLQSTGVHAEVCCIPWSWFGRCEATKSRLF